MAVRFHIPAEKTARAGILLVFLLVSAIVEGCTSSAVQSKAPLTRIAFGSCINTQSHPMLDRTLTLPFDLFILLGDNIYADTTNAAVMAAKYRVRKESAFFQALRKKAPLLATWDDHDFGWNDAGSNYVMKVESQKLFLDFMDEPTDSPRRKRDGIYDARVFGPAGQRVQIILLDTRYFRSVLATGENNAVPSGGRYIPHPDPNVTMLGEVQWKWLEEQLREPAELRIIASSIQFVSEFSGAEAWANMPREKERMLALLKKSRANGALFISGDRHWAELSRLDRDGDHPLYDLTSSALTEKHKRGTPTPNRFRDGPTFHDTNVGLITINWRATKPEILLQLFDENGSVRIEKRIVF
jgi:alkaline phosphatase D